MGTEKITVRELRRFLFDENFTCFINGTPYSNDDSRRLLFELENQEKEIEYKETGVLQLTFNI
jgi:hypothetical protein